MKFLYSIAAAAVLAVASTHAQAEPDDVPAAIAFAQEPETYDAESTVAFVDMPGAANTSDAYALTSATSNDDSNKPEDRQLQVVESIVVGLQIAAVAAPIVADIIKGRRKQCQQLACWIGTNDRSCAIAVAEKVQQEMTMGRDRYRYESIQNNGMWVRYWRTKFEPVDRGVIANGKCSNGHTFEVTNCQSTGRVHC